VRSSTLDFTRIDHQHMVLTFGGLWIQGAVATPRRACLTVPIIQGSAAGGSRHEMVQTHRRLTFTTRQQRLSSKVMQRSPEIALAFGKGLAHATVEVEQGPTELLKSAQPVLHRPSGACHTTHIIPPAGYVRIYCSG